MTAVRHFRHCGIDQGAAAPPPAFHGDEIGHWRHYQAHLGSLREALGESGE